MDMVQVKFSHIIGSLLTVFITVTGSAIGIYQKTSSDILANSKDIEHNRELIEQRLTTMEAQQARIEAQQLQILTEIRNINNPQKPTP